MKIYGYFDPRLCDDNRFFSLMDVDNKYRKMFQQLNFNMMIKEETDHVLIIGSDKKDFARYEALCVFDENKKTNDQIKSIVEIYGEYNLGISRLFRRKK